MNAGPRLTSCALPPTGGTTRGIMLAGRILPTLGKEYNFEDVWDTFHNNTPTVNLLTEKHCASNFRTDKLASAEATALVAYENDMKSNRMKVNSSKSMK